jgi:excinuclease ABC subunit B
MTKSIQALIGITTYHRRMQIAHNEAHGISPSPVLRKSQETLRLAASDTPTTGKLAEASTTDENVADVIAQLQAEMLEASQALEFERAAHLRDQIRELQSGAGLPATTPSAPPAKRKATSYRQNRARKK